MYLKRIELLGFKSFASRTVLELDSGLSALVGPNGSGKSNVVDAVRWAMGEQSLRSVRSRKSEEVIFAGNARRPAVGMAEVTLVLDNADGALALPFSEVSVTRRQYRSGEGEYLINRARARLRDVVELLSRVGLAPGGYSVVGQGAVDEVLLQRPDERRGLLESAADITRHQAKLKESLDKLSETATNLQRVEDIRGEIGPRLSKLRAQANRARRYEELAARLENLVRWQCLLQLRDARGRLVAALEVETQSAEAATEAGREMEALRREATRLREDLRREESALQAARDRVNTLRLERANREREAVLLRERAESYRSQLEQADEELGRAEAEWKELSEEAAALSETRGQRAAQEASLKAALSPLEAGRRQAAAEERLLRAQLDRLFTDQRASAGRCSELRERQAALAREARRLTDIQNESTVGSRDATQRLAALEAQLDATRDALDAAKAALAAGDASRARAIAQARALSTELEAARQVERAAWERDRDLQSRLQALRSLKEEHRGVPAAARALLASGLPGIRGTLASMIRVPDRYVTAIAAALGGAQAYVVSEDFEQGLEALRRLDGASGRVTIAPLRLDRRESPRSLVAEFKSHLEGLVGGLGFHGPASELVSCPPEAADLCARYLGLSLVVDGMADALTLYRGLSELSDGRLPFQVVTLDGSTVRARGDLVSSLNGERDGSLVARDAEMLALASATDASRAQLEGAREAVAVLEARHAELSREAEAALLEVSSARRQIEEQNSRYSSQASQVGKLEAAIEWHRSRLAATERDAAHNREAQGRLETELQAVGSREEEAGSRLKSLQRDLANVQSSLADSAGQYSKAQSELARVQNDLREMDARLSALADAVRRADARVVRQRARTAELQAAIETVSGAKPEGGADASLEELDRAEAAVAEVVARVADLRPRAESAESGLSERARSFEDEREQLAGLQGRVQRASAELRVLLREAEREAGVEVVATGSDSGQTVVAACDGAIAQLEATLSHLNLDRFPRTLPDTVGKVSALRKDLHAIGTVNAEAPEEYRQLSERHEFLGGQIQDLRQAEKTLRKAIEELREMMDARFRETFERVNAEFGRCFAVLFGGGTARLALTDPEQPLQGGVEVIAALPGRKAGSLLGLSGGERSLTAIALIFALMTVNPSPFCLLDEVDAALDESNVQRYCNMVKDLSKDTQFLLITHNRTTMEMAGVLYGVSMLADSTSKVVSLRLNGKENHA